MSFTSYSVDNDRRFRETLKAAADQVGDLRIPLGLIAADFYKSERAIFSLKGPGQYPPFKHSTGEYHKGKYLQGDESPYQIRKKKKWGFDYPLLKASGALETAATVRDGAGNITVVTSNKLELGVDSSVIPYAIYHQSDAPRKKIPLRKFLFIGPEAPRYATADQIGRLDRWMNILNKFVGQRLEALGQVKVAGNG